MKFLYLNKSAVNNILYNSEEILKLNILKT